MTVIAIKPLLIAIILVMGLSILGWGLWSAFIKPADGHGIEKF